MTPGALKAEADRARREGRFEAAEDLLRQAVAILRPEGESLALAHTIRHLADLYRHLGNADEAARCGTEGLEIYRRFADAAPPLDLANAVRSMALISEMTGNRDDARALWEEAKTLYGRCGVSSGVSESETRLTSLR
ncbi:MAG TPA: tetratricopeptide repeat protein [Thermoanaerobaculia bacterium]